MKSFIRCMAILLTIAQLFAVSAFADYEVSREVYDTMKAAASGGAVPSGVVSTVPEEAEAEAAEAAAGGASGAAAKKDAKKVDYEIAPATQPGTYEDVSIGGLRIVPGVWYTVDSEGVLTSSEPWPDSYLFYSASQSKLTLHEFHYKVPGDVTGKDDTFAALYLPKNMQIVLEGENELVNRSYTKAGGGMSNGVYAPDCVITFTGDGVLKVNTVADASLKGYGIGAGNIRIDGDFVGLTVFGVTSAFSSAPSIVGSRKMLANVADLHPEYHADVRVREASPYDQSIFTRFRYVLIAVGNEISPQEEARAKIEAEYYRTKMEYNVAVDEGYAEAFSTYNTEMNNGLMEFGMAIDQEMSAIDANMNSVQNDFTFGYSQEFDSPASEAYFQLGRLLMSGGA